MTRSVRSFFGLALLVALAVPVLTQAEWVQKEIRWTLSGVTGDGSSIYVRDTSKVVFGGGTTTLDTTGWFSLKDAQPLPRGALYPATADLLQGTAFQNDTTIAGWLVFAADSTNAANACTMTSLTVFIEGRAGAFGQPVTLARGWVKSDSLVVSSATPATTGMTSASDETVIVPIRTIGVYGNIFKWAQLRARISAATGTMSSCRAFVRYWRNAVTGTGVE